MYCSLLRTSVLLILIKYSFHIKHAQSSVFSKTCVTTFKKIYKINEKDIVICFFSDTISFLHPFLLVITYSLLNSIPYLHLLFLKFTCNLLRHVWTWDSKQPQDPYLQSLSQFMQNFEFFNFLVKALKWTTSLTNFLGYCKDITN